MEDIFFWFYDLMVLVILTVLIYSSFKKGISKTFIIITGYILSIFIGSKYSMNIATSVYEKYFQEKSISAIEKSISGLNFSQQYKLYIESLGYSIKIDTAKLDEIFESGENITEKVYDYCSSLKGDDFQQEEIFKEDFENGFKSVLNESFENNAFLNVEEISQQFDESIKMMYNQDKDITVLYIEENLTRKSILNIINTVVFIGLMIVVMFFVRIISDKTTKFIPDFGIVDHVIGAISGLAETVLILLIVSAVLEILVIIGNNEMILFNTETIEKTIIFKYIYNFN